MFSDRVHASFYFGGLILLVVSLPFSVFTLSVAQITLMVNWVLEGKWTQKWDIAGRTPALWIIVIFYLVHLIWLLNTGNFDWGLHDLKIKLPLLVLPVIIATSPSLGEKQLKILLNLFIAALLVGTFYSMYYICIHVGNPLITFPFVSHIRWSLMLVLGIFFAVWLIGKTKAWKWFFYVLVIFWIACYLVLVLKALTGIVMLCFLLAFFLFRAAFISRDLLLKWFSVVALISVFLVSLSYFVHAYSRFFSFEGVDKDSLALFTSQGNPYHHDFENKSVENGHFINLYLCEPELKEAWNKRSEISYDSITRNNLVIKHCIIRYLTSKNLRKDGEGIESLTAREVNFIEQGAANYLDTIKFGLYPRVYRAFWELYHYSIGANPSGYSISQRLEFLKTAYHIIQRNFWFGVGTGDVPNEFAFQYEIDQSPLKPENRLRAHNQFVTFFVAFGFLGFLAIAFSLIAPPIFEKKFRNYLFLVIFLLGFLSFLNEDTLETHQGISMFAVFYTLFLFYKHDKTD